MDPDDELDDEGASGPLLPPDDRLWRHPSEVALARAGGSSPSSRAARVLENRMWTVAVLAGTIGALLASGVAIASGHLRTRTVSVPAVEQDLISPIATLAVSGATYGASAEKVRQSCVDLVAHDSHGLRSAHGVIFRSDGMLITVAHAVVGAQSLFATVGGTRRIPARVVASDPASDLAVLKLDGSGYTPAPMGSALDLQLGDPVLAIHPLQVPAAPGDVPGDQSSVSGLGETVPGPGGVRLADLLKLSSTPTTNEVGGPLLDVRGAVVGLVTALGSGGTAFATPVDLAREVATQLLTTGKVVPVWLGVEGSDLDAARAKSLGAAGGAVVEKTYPSSPAAAAGLKGGDIILGVDGRVVTSMANLIMALHARPPGTVVDLDVHRNGTEQEIEATLAARPPGIA